MTAAGSPAAPRDRPPDGTARTRLRAGFLCAVLAAALAGCAAPEEDPVMQRLRAIADPRAVRSVAAMLKAYGGYAAWRRLHNVEYSYRLRIYDGQGEPQFVTHQLHRLGLGPTVRVYVEDLDVASPQVVRLDGGTIAVTRGGVPIQDPSLLEFPRAFGKIVRWSFRAPWVLLDQGSQLEGRAVRTPEGPGPVPIGPCDVVRLRFTDPPPGGSVDDWRDFYISQRSRLVERIHSYRAEDQSYRLVIWSDHRTIDGVRIAARRETYASDLDGGIGSLQAVAEYEDVRFNVPLDDATFRGGVSLAAPGDGDPANP